MTVSQALGLHTLAQFETSQAIETLIDGDLKRLSPSEQLSEQIYRWDYDLLDAFVTQRFVPQGKNISDLAQKLYLERKVDLLQQRAKEQSLETEKVRQSFQRLRAHIKDIACAPEQNPPVGLGVILSSCLPSRFIIPGTMQQYRRASDSKRRDLHDQKLKNKFEAYTSTKGAHWGKELKEAFLPLQGRDITAVARILTAEQVTELISATPNNEQMEKQLPRFLVSLNHERIEELLENLPNNELQKLNTILKRSPEIKEHWFQTMFLEFRDGFVEEVNKKRYAIDDLNNRLRNITLDSINENHLKEISNLELDIQARHDRLKQLCTLIDGVVDEAETKYLSSEGLPSAYATLLKRLSPDETRFAKDAAAPYGILYRRIFDGVDLFSPASLYFDKWELPEEVRKKAELKSITLVRDLKNHRLFNRTLLINFIEKDTHDKD